MRRISECISFQSSNWSSLEREVRPGCQGDRAVKQGFLRYYTGPEPAILDWYGH